MKKKDEKLHEFNEQKEISARKNEIAVNILQFNKEMKRIKGTMEKEIFRLEEFKNKFKDQRLISNKIELLKRVLVATRYGLDRQNVRLYDIEDGTLNK